MNLILERMVDAEMVDKVASGYNSLQPGEPLYIYLCSQGGSLWSASAIIDIININKDNTILTVYGNIASSAFLIFFKAECTKRILPETFATVHSSTYSVDIREMGIAGGNHSTFVEKFMKDYGKSIITMLEQSVLTPEEVQGYKRGEDIFIPYKRLVRIFK